MHIHHYDAPQSHPSWVVPNPLHETLHKYFPWSDYLHTHGLYHHQNRCYKSCNLPNGSCSVIQWDSHRNPYYVKSLLPYHIHSALKISPAWWYIHHIPPLWPYILLSSSPMTHRGPHHYGCPQVPTIPCGQYQSGLDRCSHHSLSLLL